ncbi:MAG TPA: cyclic pyranopterin monophosphate synthase MoaC [Lentimicrobium sp.]|nr:cyclic pyranopterin monophosphate synthase MoaC [Lentimicrobium sp.]
MDKKGKALSHIDEKGNANMVDIGFKPVQERIAKASGRISLQPETINLIKENLIKKGDVLTVAEIAGIQAAKQTSSIIPLCHPLQITKIDVRTEITATGIDVTATAKCIGQTGIEMEALTAVSVALLTIYDMCKAVDKTMVISEIALTEKKKQEIIR